MPLVKRPDDSRPYMKEESIACDDKFGNIFESIPKTIIEPPDAHIQPKMYNRIFKTPINAGYPLKHQYMHKKRPSFEDNKDTYCIKGSPISIKNKPLMTSRRNVTTSYKQIKNVSLDQP